MDFHKIFILFCFVALALKIQENEAEENVTSVAIDTNVTTIQRT